jgi:histidine kinase
MPNGNRLLGIITPICNEPGCSTGDCHFHPADKKILGALDVVVSLEKTYHAEIRGTGGALRPVAVFFFMVTAAIILVFLLRFVNPAGQDPDRGTEQIAKGNYDGTVEVHQGDEMGQLAGAINRMGRNRRQTGRAEKTARRVPGPVRTGCPA